MRYPTFTSYLLKDCDQRLLGAGYAATIDGEIVDRFSLIIGSGGGVYVVAVAVAVFLSLTIKGSAV
jgi:hypothetical protein